MTQASCVLAILKCSSCHAHECILFCVKESERCASETSDPESLYGDKIQNLNQIKNQNSFPLPSDAACTTVSSETNAKYRRQTDPDSKGGELEINKMVRLTEIYFKICPLFRFAIQNFLGS